MYRYFAVIFLVLGFYSESFSQVVVTIQGVPPSHTVNTDEFPLLKLNVRLTDNGSQKELTPNSFYILEGAMVCEPVEVSQLQNGWQTVKWYTKLNDFTQLGEYFGQLLTVYNNIPDRKIISGYLEKLPILYVFSSSNNQQVRDANWGPGISPGNSIPFQILVRGYMQNSRTMNQTPIKIDSLTTKTPIFKIKWLGPLIGEKREPPAEIGVNIDYLVNIFFEPDKFGYFQDVLTIHFNNGMKRHIPLYGNTFNVEVEKLMELTEPVKGTVLSPCQDVTIKWKGHSPDNPVEIYYSTDAGFEWKLIDVVKDSTYTWRVPNIETRFLYFRVRQDFKNSKLEVLSEDGFPVYSVNFNYPGTILSSVNSMGKVMTWDLVSQQVPQLLRRHYIEENNPDSQERYYSFGLEYSSDDNKFFAGYRNYLMPAFMQRDTIGIFTSDNIYPSKKIALPLGFRARKLKSDRAKKILTVFPEYGSKLLQYSMETDEFIKEFSFEAPIMDIAFNTNSDSAAVLLINGRIKLVTLNDFRIFDELNFDIFPNFLEIAYSPNGKFLSIGTQSDESGLKTNIYLIDIAERKIVRVFNPSAGNPVSLQFNPTSTSLVVGSRTDKQIAIYDLTTNQPSASLFGHFDNMTDMKMSPTGLSIVSTSLSQQDNIVYRTFTYPQEDQSDGYLIIEKPILNEELIKIENAYLGTSNPNNINTICNVGRSMADISDAKFSKGKNFKLSKVWIRDTTFAGDCFDFDIIYAPLDTGIVRDTLILYHCSKQYRIPFESYSYPRNITLLNNGYDFGEVCIGDSVAKEIPLFRNDDPVPLIVNYTTIREKDDLYFNILGRVRDTIIQPGGIYYVNLTFSPDELGLSNAEIIIVHSNQEEIYETSNTQGIGIGSYVSISHEVLRFIPEVPIRELLIENTGLTDIYFDKFSVEPTGAFNVLTPAEFNLKPGEKKTIEIEWNGVDENISELIIDANPCLIQRSVVLGFYRGTSIVTLPIVEAEANDENVRIPIIYKNTENGPYSGERIFEADLTVNSKIFLPRNVQSKFGAAELTSNKVVAGVRTFGIKVVGDFPANDTIATIVGVAGLTDTDRSQILLTDNSTFWSRFVETETQPGQIIITGICEDRYVKKNNSIISNLLVIPNPVIDNVKIKFELVEDAEVVCDIIDNTGFSRRICSYFEGKAGENILNLNLSNYGTGNYKILIKSDADYIMSNLIIMR